MLEFALALFAAWLPEVSLLINCGATGTLLDFYS